MHLINIKCNDSNSFKYSIIVYLYFYNIKNNYLRPTEINKESNLYIQVFFNENNYIYQFEKYNTFIHLLIIDINDKPIFLTRNNAKIEVTIVKLNNHRHSFYKPTLERFNNNDINEIERLNSIAPKIYKIT